MMARRAMHLRWNYVEDHPVLFGGLFLASLTAAGLVAFLVADPLRGLLLGILPIMFALAVWGFTNRASYRLRHPNSLPEQRARVREQAPAATAGDPFAEPRAPLSPAEHARRTAGKKKEGRRRKGKPDAT